MFAAVSAGLIFGISAGLAPGPLLALVITETLRHGVAEGIKVSLAPLVTDLPIILFSLLAIDRLSHHGGVLGGISLAGAFYVLHLAWKSVQTGPVTLDTDAEAPGSLAKGSLVNLLNPHPYLFWMTVGAPFIIKAREAGLPAQALFVVSFYLLLVGSKVTLAVITGRSRSFLSGRGYIIIMRGLGMALGVFALILFRDALQFWHLLAP
jgi:threonine/homoserine/homoserine lactone efflux protein